MTVRINTARQFPIPGSRARWRRRSRGYVPWHFTHEKLLQQLTNLPLYMGSWESGGGRGAGDAAVATPCQGRELLAGGTSSPGAPGAGLGAAVPACSRCSGASLHCGTDGRRASVLREGGRCRCAGAAGGVPAGGERGAGRGGRGTEGLGRRRRGLGQEKLLDAVTWSGPAEQPLAA